MNKKSSPADIDPSLDKLFGSKSRVKLLQLFFRNTDKSFYVREITRMIGEQVNSVRRELTNMQQLGICRSDTYDNKLYYAVNKDSRHYRALKLLFAPSPDDTEPSAPQKRSAERASSWDIAIKPVEDLVELLLVIDTSKNKNSQVDMFIVGNDAGRQISKWATLIEKKHGRPLNYVILTREDYYYRHSIRDRFVHGVLALPYTVVINKAIIKGE